MQELSDHTAFYILIICFIHLFPFHCYKTIAFRLMVYSKARFYLHVTVQNTYSHYLFESSHKLNSDDSCGEISWELLGLLRLNLSC